MVIVVLRKRHLKEDETVGVVIVTGLVVVVSISVIVSVIVSVSVSFLCIIEATAILARAEWQQDTQDRV